MRGTIRRGIVGPAIAPRAFILERLSRAGRSAGLCCGVALLSGVFPVARPARAQELTSQVLSESGGRSSSGSTELTLSQGQAVIGSAVSGTTDLSIGFIHALSIQSVEVSSPAATNPPFPLVGLSSLTVAWLANGNPAGALYEARLSTAADFSSVLGSSQTYNLNATFTGLSPNTIYYARAAAYSTEVSSWSSFAALGSTYTLAAPPGSPIGVSTFTAPTGSGFTINWSSGTTGSGFNPSGTLYLAQVSTSADFLTVWASSQTAGLNAVFAGLDEYVNYYARVRGINGNGIATDFTVLGSTSTGLPFVFPGIINTVAGKSSYGYSGDGGQATSAELNLSYGVAVDTIGNIYIADSSNLRVRKVDSDGHITTFAGTGSVGSYGYYGDGGPSTSAKLSYPIGVAADSLGNVYIADYGDYVVRKVNSAGVISTVVPPGILLQPTAVAADTMGNIYIADSGNNCIRKVDSVGTLTTFAGTGVNGNTGDGGLASTATLNVPYGVAVDVWGSVYIADTGNHRIRKVSSGTITTIAGTIAGFSGDGGLASTATLNTPHGVSLDAMGNIYVTDSANWRIRKVDSAGIITTVAGSWNSSSSGDGGPATSAYVPSMFGIDAAAIGKIYIAQYGSGGPRIREVSVATAAPASAALIAAAKTPTSIQWYWNKVPRTAAYKLLTSTSGAISGAISNRNTYFIETALSTNTFYSRELVTINSAGTSTSIVVSAYTLADAPSGIAFGGTSTSTVYLTWNANSNPGSTSFEVSYTTTANFAAGSTISTAPTTTSTFTTVASLAGQTTYYFRVRAYNGDSIATAFTSVAATATAVLQSSVTALSVSTGTIGVAFIITGTDLGTSNGDTTRVRFGAGGSTAPITSWNATQISAVVPLLSSGAYALLIERQGSVFTTTDAGTFTVVTPIISSAAAIGGGAPGFDLVGSGFGNFVDSSTTRVTLDGTEVEYSSWADAVIRCVVPSSISPGSHTALVIISTSVGTVQSNGYTFDVTSEMKPSGFFASSSAMPRWFYQANLRLRAVSGGKVTALSLASVSVPPGSLAADTSMSIDRGELSGEDNDVREKARASAALGVMGAPIEFGPSGTQFALPVTIELPYDLASVPLGRESSLAVHYWDRTAGTWVALQTEVDTVRHLLRARTDHFSLYQPLLSGIRPAAVAPAEFRLVDVYAFPNPARRSQTVTIRSQVGLADDVAIRIYDISGRLVHSGSVGSPQIIDDGNGKGSQYTYDYVWDTGGAGSGVYLFAITAKKAGSSPIQKTGKVGVIK